MMLWKQCELKKNHLSMMKSSLSRHLLILRVVLDSKDLKLYTTLSSTLTIDVQMEVGRMYDEPRRSFETFRQNVNKLTLNVKRKKNHAFTENDYA